MALFPAYSQDPVVQVETREDLDAWDIAERSIQETSPGSPPSPHHEDFLLSDPLPAPPSPPPPPAMDYYEDRKRDPANIAVSTLYYPGRPQYIPRKTYPSNTKRRKTPRYFTKPTGDRGGAVTLAEGRGAWYRASLEKGAGRDTWMEYVHYLAYYMEDLRSALQVCEEAIKKGIDVHDIWHNLLQEKVTTAQYGDVVKDLLAKESCPKLRTILWIRLSVALPLPEARHVVRKALEDVRKTDYLYCDMMQVFGCILRNAGFWEELVQLIELVLEVYGVGGGGLDTLPVDKAAEDELELYEMKLISSGLPLGEVWRRIELARGTIHWRPLAMSPDNLAIQADPDRAPSRNRNADLLTPITDSLSWFRICVWSILSLESIMPSNHNSCLSIFGTPYIWLSHVDTPAAVLQLIYSGRKLPGLKDERVKELISVLPARNYSKYQKDPSGFGAYVENVWTRCLSSTNGPPRMALLLMKLKADVNRVRVLTLQGNIEEARRVISSCRLLIKKFGDNAPLPLAVLARAEFAANKNVRERSERATQLLLRALNAAILDDTVPECHALYIARVLSEISTNSSLNAWAIVCAVFRKPLPDDYSSPPSREIKCDALLKVGQVIAKTDMDMEQDYHRVERDIRLLLSKADIICEQECTQLEEYLQSNQPSIWETLTCSPYEWGATRISLLNGEERGKMLKGLAAMGSDGKMGLIGEMGSIGEVGSKGESYLEICACALLDKASYQERRQFVNVFADRFPCNTYLAMMSSECTTWWDIQNPLVSEIRSRIRGLAGVVYGVRKTGRGLKGLARGLANVFKGEETTLSSPTRWQLLLPNPSPLPNAELMIASGMRLRALPAELMPLT